MKNAKFEDKELEEFLFSTCGVDPISIYPLSKPLPVNKPDLSPGTISVKRVTDLSWYHEENKQFVLCMCLNESESKAQNNELELYQVHVEV